MHRLAEDREILQSSCGLQTVIALVIQRHFSVGVPFDPHGSSSISSGKAIRSSV